MLFAFVFLKPFPSIPPLCVIALSTTIQIKHTPRDASILNQRRRRQSARQQVKQSRALRQLRLLRVVSVCHPRLPVSPSLVRSVQLPIGRSRAERIPRRGLLLAQLPREFDAPIRATGAGNCCSPAQSLSLSPATSQSTSTWAAKQQTAATSSSGFLFVLLSVVLLLCYHVLLPRAPAPVLLVCV